MFGEPKWAARHATHRGLHGRKHVDKERRLALFLVVSGLFRVLCWTVIMLAFIAGVGFVVGWFASVKFVALLSILALILTDFGQVCASLAQLAAAHGHADSEATRKEVSIDYTQIERDIARLAQLTPGPECDELVLSIRKRLRENRG